MKKYKLGLIGYGGFGQFLHAAWVNNKAVELIAIADVQPKQEIPNGITFYHNWKKLINNSSIEIVSIATPPATHAEIACLSLEMGKHVLLEKPMATSLSDAQKIIDVAKNSNRVLMIDYMLRFHPLIEILKDWTQSASFGRLRRIGVENYAQDESLPKNHWFWDQTQSGGILVEHAVHFIDLVNYISGSNPNYVSGTSHWRNEKQEDQALVTVRYENGLIATHYHDFSRPGFFEQTSLVFVFDLAQITLNGWIPISGHFTALINQQTEKELSRLPQLEINQNVPINEVDNLSRPAGWGGITSLSPKSSSEVHSGGKYYQVDKLVSGRFALSKTKGEIYGEVLNSLLTEFITAIENPGYHPRITPMDGYNSLRIALQGKKSFKVFLPQN
ncbi:MAG: Gfo/Idh/MocA family oxidoreductase [Candidatus Marinimicrobia bacterium]|nr:Gfo/Idh/MocA family oxidoreductase [Candidatus Neomarinimicrobiota bacterium]